LPSRSTLFPYTTLFRSPPLAESPVETAVVSEPAPPPAEPAEESGAAQIALHTEPPPQAAPAPLVAAPAPPAPVAAAPAPADEPRSEEHTSELQSPDQLV